MARARTPFRAALRFSAAVLMVSGALLMLDALATLVWQEPISWTIASSRQAGLEQELGELSSGDARGGDIAAAAGQLAGRTKRGRALGRISIPTLRRSYVVVQGVGASELRKAGHYSDTPMPGQRRTVAVAGHRTTYLAPFRAIDRLRRGSRSF